MYIFTLSAFSLIENFWNIISVFLLHLTQCRVATSQIVLCYLDTSPSVEQGLVCESKYLFLYLQISSSMFMLIQSLLLQNKCDLENMVHGSLKIENTRIQSIKIWRRFWRRNFLDSWLCGSSGIHGNCWRYVIFFHYILCFHSISISNIN